MGRIHGGHVVARALRREGVDVVFALTGGHVLPVLDGCVQEGIRVVDVRHEQAAAHAAEAYTRLTGRLGVAVVTAGPGVTDAVTGLATAFHSRTPMLLVAGRHMLRQEQRGGLQEMDHLALVRSVSVWAATGWQVVRLADHVATAARHAFAGRGGPAFLDVPMDVLFDDVDEDAVIWPVGYRATRPSGLDPVTLDEVVGRLAAAERPVVFSSAWSRGGDSRLVEVAEALGAPVFVNGKARGSLPHGHPLLGNHARSAAFSGCDLVLALGVDWDFRTSYGQKVAEDADVIHVDPEPARIGWNRPVTLGVVADPAVAVSQLADEGHRFARTDTSAWTKEIMAEEADRQAQAEEEAASEDAPLAPQRFARDVASFFGPDAIVAVDGGDIVSTTARWLQVSHPGNVLDPGPFGALGTGVPYALAAKVAFPDALVGIVFGDGAFGFNGMEYDTLVRLGIPVVGVLGNDGVWANIKTVHRMFFPERVVAADLGRRPYHAMVEGLGGHGELVTRPGDLPPALERARRSGRPALVNVHVAETMRMSSNYEQ